MVSRSSRVINIWMDIFSINHYLFNNIVNFFKFFSGIPLDKGLDTFKILNGINTYKIIADDLEFGEGFICEKGVVGVKQLTDLF